MNRSTQEFKGGCGEIVFLPELEAEVQELERVFPKDAVPGQLFKHEWKGGRLRVWTEIDPDWKAPAQEPGGNLPESNVIQPVPKLAQLLDWKMEDLITKAAELSVPFEAGEPKKQLAPKIIAAWTKRNSEQKAR